MARAVLQAALQHIRAAGAPDLRGRSDGDLLRMFAVNGDSTAFTAIVRRHGPLVLGVCRRVLPRVQDAEDAFQATFLLLASRSRSVRKRESLAGWLHGVAYRMAKNAQRAAARRRRHEGRAESAKPSSPIWEAAWREVKTIIDDEVLRLPAAQREVFVLCCLENQSYAEAARRLGVLEGTVGSRLTVAKARLRQRLGRRGVDLAAAMAALALASTDAIAAVPRSLVMAAVQVAIGEVSVAGAASATVTALVHGATKAMFLTKLKTAAILAVTIGVVGTGFGVTAHRSAQAQVNSPVGQVTPADERPAGVTPKPTTKFGEGWSTTVEFSSQTAGGKKAVTARWNLSVEKGWLLARRESAEGDLEWQIVLARAADGPQPEAQTDEYGNFEIKYDRYFVRDGGRWVRAFRERKTAAAAPWPALSLASGGRSMGFGGTEPRLAGWEIGDWYWAVSGPQTRPDVLIRLQHKALNEGGYGFTGARTFARMNCGQRMVQDDGDLLVAESTTKQDVDEALRVKAFRKEIGTKPAPALAVGKWFNSSDGLDLGTLKGKVVLLDFWGTWCGPCVAKLPKTEELHQKYKDRGLVVIGVHSANGSEKVGEFLKEKGYTFPVVIDDGGTANQYTVESWPTYFLIDKTGKLVWGFKNEPPKESQIEELLK